MEFFIKVNVNIHTYDTHTIYTYICYICCMKAEEKEFLRIVTIKSCRLCFIV